MVLLIIGLTVVIIALIVITQKQPSNIPVKPEIQIETTSPSVIKKTHNDIYPISIYSSNTNPSYVSCERLGRKGYSEDFFESYLRKYFESSLEIKTNYCLKYEGVNYEPDFTIIYTSGDKKMFIDLEIDEPYEGIDDVQNRKPIHVFGSDSERNFIFTKNGWNVLRLSEQQIVKNPLSCCKYIAEFIHSLDSSFVMPDSLSEVTEIEEEKTWTWNEAKAFSLESHREKYLNIESFPSAVKETLNDYECIYVAPNFDSNLRKIINIPDYKNLRVIDRDGSIYQLIVHDDNHKRLDKQDSIKFIRKDEAWLNDISMCRGSYGIYYEIRRSLSIEEFEEFLRNLPDK